MAKQNKTIDPTTYAVCVSTFDSLVEELGNRIEFATQSFVMANVRDLGQVLLDPDGRIVTVAAHVPAHIFAAGNSVENVINTFDNQFEPDDFIVGNDPYIIESGHLPDWTFVRPCFYEGELVCFFQVRGHMSDTGGFYLGGYSPGAYDIIAEGLNIPPIKLLKGGKLNKDAWDIIKRNVRNSNQVEMDTFLMDSAMKKSEQGIQRLCKKYGIDVVRASMDRFIEAGEDAMRREISKMKDGVYTAERFTDWDGTTDKPVYARCTTIVEGDEITFDLTECDPQCDFINSPLGNTEMSVLNGLYSMIDPSVPKNYGSMRKAVKIITKPGTVVHPIRPATVGACAITIGVNITEAVQCTLIEANPERALGGSERHVGPLFMGSDPRKIDPRTGQPYTYWSETFANDGSSGGRKGYDGWIGVGCWVHMGALLRPDIEFFENSAPYIVKSYQIMEDWEGAGEYRGGPGIFVETVSHVPEGKHSFIATGNSDGMTQAPFGAMGGGETPMVEMYIDRAATGEREELRTMTQVMSFPGDVVVTKVGGGGGWGNPLKRDPQRVLKDYLDRFVSLDRAKNVYGVVIDAENNVVDLEATEKLRASMA